jgi:hypothetical protein
MSEQDESARPEGRGPWLGQWAAPEGDADGRADIVSESWQIPRSVANPARLRLGGSPLGVPSRGYGVA